MTQNGGLQLISAQPQLIRESFELQPFRILLNLSVSAGCLKRIAGNNRSRQMHSKRGYLYSPLELIVIFLEEILQLLRL